MKKQIFALLLALTLLTGCAGRKEAAQTPKAAPATVPAQETVPQETPAQETTPREVSFDYSPGKMGAYVKADPSIQAGPEVLDSVSMTWPDNVTRVRVSDIQYDFVRGGEQVGGFLLVDISEDMLKNAGNSVEEYDALMDCLGKQIMPDGYPSNAHVQGGYSGFGNEYLFGFLERNDFGAQYEFNLYVGQRYCYVFWIDDFWWGDSGMGVMESLAAEDIQPERNQAAFLWDAEDRPRTGRP